MTALTDRSEILFVYEVRDANPNGDPMDENRPRVDPETGVVTVTDVRIKRTVRDYWHDRKGLEVLVRDTFSEAGFLRDGKGRASDFFEAGEVDFKADSVGEIERKLAVAVTRECIDVRAFGSTLPFEKGKKKGSLALTGAVQLSGFNRSLHRVATQFVQGTAAFASTAEASQKSFREDYIVSYACIACYGVVNELAARTTGMTEDDRRALLEGLWRGTEDLISRSKMGHRPLLLLHLVYKDGYRLSDLASRIALRSELDDLKLRSVKDYALDVSELWGAIGRASKRIQRVEYEHAPELALEVGGDAASFAVDGVKFEALGIWD